MLYIIHSQRLSNRHARVQNTVSAIRKVLPDIKTNFILQHDPKDVANLIKERMNTDATGTPEFDRFLGQMTPERFSNIEKHREAWRRIVSDASDKKDYNIIMEDDSILLPDVVDNFVDSVRAWMQSSTADICLLGISLGDPDEPLQLNDLSGQVKVLPAKEAYLVTSEGAKKLLELTDKVKFHLRIMMSWFIDNGSIKAVCPSKRVSLEGSKVGIYPSSVHPNNMLHFNKEYMEMLGYSNKSNEEVKASIKDINKIYKSVEHMRSPDMMHLYGVLLYKAGRVEDADDVLNMAVVEMEKQNGLLNANSELLNNLINIQEALQYDVAQLSKEKSRYAVSVSTMASDARPPRRPAD